MIPLHPAARPSLQGSFVLSFTKLSRGGFHCIYVFEIMLFRGQMPYRMSRSTVYFARYLRQLVRQCDA
jgi:hypothetical protein